MARDPQQSSASKPRRWLAWLAVGGLMLGLTAFYQAVIPERGGLVRSESGMAGAAIELQRDRGGHYRVPGEINGYAVSFLVDTGATDVAVSERLAREIGLDFGPRTMVMTAAGPAPAWRARLDRVTAGALQRDNVRATITPGLGNQVLLGMSFLRHFEIRQQGERLLIQSAVTDR
ncbi:MAG: TIGR02281 family clan AA aspartic protease [Gammaproteobacteria bacterium]|nr:TIGR02281 family clan AA aspartic protease [Gammaproteobacteria bacterium]